MRSLVHVMFTGLYTFEYEFNNMEDVNVLFRLFNLWRHHELVGSGQYFACDLRVGSGRKILAVWFGSLTENEPVAISGVDPIAIAIPMYICHLYVYIRIKTIPQ